MSVVWCEDNEITGICQAKSLNSIDTHTSLGITDVTPTDCWMNVWCTRHKKNWSGSKPNFIHFLQIIEDYSTCSENTVNKKSKKDLYFSLFFYCFLHSYFSVLIYTVVYFVLFIKNRSLMYKAHKFGNTSGVSKSSTDWLNSQGFLWETCVWNSLKVHLVHPLVTARVVAPQEW